MENKVATIQNPIIEDNLTFTFPNGASSTKYDDWSFYRNQFNSAFGGAKAVDIIYLEHDTCWLIEIKDYRINRRMKAIDISKEIAIKVRDAMSGIYAASCNANNQDEKSFAIDAIKKRKIRVVLHLEQPPVNSRLFPRVAEPANIVMSLKMLLKGIDAHPIVMDKKMRLNKIKWVVS